MRVQNGLRVLSKDSREANIVNADAKLSLLVKGYYTRKEEPKESENTESK